jgi:dethiobiotin synthetase
VTAFFITASGTEVGKTFTAEILIQQWREEGYEVRAIKPVISGYDPRAAAETDTGRLLAALGRPLTPENVNLVSPCRYAAALSPDMAAAREGRVVPFDEVVEYCRTVVADAAAANDPLLIEGIGGVMVPLDDTHTVLDLIVAVGVPVILVGGSYLGSLSHTLTAFDVLRSRDVAVDSIVVSETPGSAVPLDETRAALARFVRPVPVHVFPFTPATSTRG